MAVTNKPSVTTYQVGDEVFFMENNVPASALVTKTISEVTDVDSNNTAEEVVKYFLAGRGAVAFAGNKLFASGADLLDNLSDAIDAL